MRDRYFGRHGYQFEAQWAVTGGLHRNCGNHFGNVVAVRGSVAVKGQGVFQNRATGQSENKGWVCVTTDLFSGCSAHLTNRSAPDNVRQAQMWEYAVASSWFTWITGQNRPVWIAGDFNLTYAENSSAWDGWWYSAFRDADTYGRSRQAKRSTTNRGRAIDYIFSNATLTGAAYIYDVRASDHHWYQMYC